MVIGIKDVIKLGAITVATCCAVFVCALFLNYNIDVAGIKDRITTLQGMVMYDAQVASGKVTAGISGGCLVMTAAVLLVFYVKNHIDTHGKELGILKALGYSRLHIAKHFWVFGLSVLVGSLLGFAGAWIYLPTFYEVQNNEGLFPAMSPQFHSLLALTLIFLPAVFFSLLAVLYAYFKLKTPVLHLLKETQTVKVRQTKDAEKEHSFLTDLRKGTLRSRRILVFFICFSAFCFSSMTQMAMSMDELASENFSWMILVIGLTLAFVTLLMSLTSVIKANTKTIAMLKVFGYSRKECGRAILGGYRPVSYIGFAVGTLYQYFLLRIMVDLVFAKLDNIPEFHFNTQALIISFFTFIAAYELVMYWYSKKIGSYSVKSVMLE